MVWKWFCSNKIPGSYLLEAYAAHLSTREQCSISHCDSKPLRKSGNWNPGANKTKDNSRMWLFKTPAQTCSKLGTICVLHLSFMSCDGLVGLQRASYTDRKQETASGLEASAAARIPNTSLVTFYTHSFHCPMSNNTQSTHSHTHTCWYGVHKCIVGCALSLLAISLSLTHTQSARQLSRQAGRQAAGSIR